MMTSQLPVGRQSYASPDKRAYQTVQILLKIDQAAALRGGHNAPASTVKLDVDPATLSQVERDVLAAVLVDGHDATIRGIQCESEGIEGGLYGERDRRQYGSGEPTAPLLLKRPDVDGLKEAITEMVAAKNAAHAKLAAEVAKKQEEARKEFHARQSAPATQTTVFLNYDGQESSFDRVVEVTYPHQSTYHSHTWNLSPVDKVDYDAWEKATEAANEKAKAEAIAAAQPLLRAKLAERKAAADKVAAERATFIARLPEAFRGRIRDGFASRDEIEAAIQNLARKDARLTLDGFKEWKEFTRLSDPEYEQLVAFRKEIAARLPEAEVRPMWVADSTGHYRKATQEELEDENPDVDSDGDVWEEPRNERRTMLVTWTVAGIEVQATKDFVS